MNQRRKFIGTALTATAAGLFTGKATAQSFINLNSAPTTIKPNRLKKGDTIGLIAPGYAISTDSLEKGKKALKEMGFVPYHTDRIIGNYGYFSNTDEERIADIHQIAQTYLDALPAFQTNEVINLYGWSLGGKIALEIGYILEQQNYKNINIYILDTLIKDDYIERLSDEISDEEYEQKVRAF